MVRCSTFRILAVIFVSTAFFPGNTFAQTTITIGTGTNTNTTTTYPAPYGNWYFGAKNQFLIRANELSAAGMIAGNITDLGFQVFNDQGVALNGFTIALKNTPTNTLSTFETGTTVVYGPQTYTEFNGWNMHTFSTPFYWDGVSNLLVQTCFNNTSYTLNAQVYLSNTSFTSSVVYFADMGGVCAQPTPFQNYNARPHIRLVYVPNNIPPVANFTANATTSCSGTISFTDLSSNFPTSWYWDFGDGNNSTQQNPIHNYTGNGTYTVTLIATNTYGSDTIVFPNYITINSSVPLPVPASCTPVTQNGSFGFGITNFSLNTINNSSSDASAGYEDFTCIQTTLYAGQNYTVAYDHLVPSTHNSAVWIDFNNDGIFNNITERVFTSNSSLSPWGNIAIPSTATLNTPLRLRVWADYDFSAPPSPCGNPDYGQAEDYTVIIEPNPFPPDAAFTVDDENTCTGTVCFEDLSQNVPTSWFWNFGDGNTSVLQFPCHTYTADGTYDVTLIVTNDNGSDTLAVTAAVTVNTAAAVTTPSCTPNTLGYCCGYGIYKVEFNTINNTTPDGAEGYMDFSCDIQTTVTEGTMYTLTVRTGIGNPQDTRAWIDFNNDGIFDPAEMIMDAPNDYDPSANITIPAGAVLNTPLRMRVSSDVVGTPHTGCTNNDFGQTEDYGIIILPNTNPPVAGFSALPTSACSSPIQFTDLSLNAPTSWLWNFGDGNTDTVQNPLYTYLSPGVYTVTLIVTNANGSDTAIKFNYITINCDTVIMPPFGTQNYTTCTGTVYDDGGPFGNYSNNTNGIIVIEPPGAGTITLTFTYFDFVASQPGDTLYVYDGNSIAAPLLGAFTGNGLPPQMVSTGGAMTLQQKTNGSVTDPGFTATWSCSTGEEEFTITKLSVYPNPSSGILNVFVPETVSIQLFNNIGMKVWGAEDISGKISLDISVFANGIYFLEAGANGKIHAVEKIIIQK